LTVVKEVAQVESAARQDPVDMVVMRVMVEMGVTL
jgi:hypothetical protein